MFLFPWDGGGVKFRKIQAVCGMHCPKKIDSELCCPVSLQLSVRLLDKVCACGDPDLLRPTNALARLDSFPDVALTSAVDRCLS